MKLELTQEILKKFLHYDQETGIITRLHDSRKFKKGDVVKETNKSGHINIRFYGSTQLAHRLAWLYVYGWMPTQIDHINCIKTDNRIANLRQASNSENQQNRLTAKRTNTSGYLGVSRHLSSGKWQAQIRLGKVHRHLGIFEDPYLGHVEYLKAKKELHPFATLIGEINEAP